MSGQDSELTWTERLVKLQESRPGFAQPWETDAEWQRLARRILEAALADAEYAGRIKPRNSAEETALHACREELVWWFDSDWCALICEVVGIGWQPYMRGGLHLLAAA